MKNVNSNKWKYIGREKWSHYFKFAMGLGCAKIAEKYFVKFARYCCGVKVFRCCQQYDFTIFYGYWLN